MRHLVWDWNGTLLDDLELTIEATNATIIAAGGRVITVDEHRRAFRRPLTSYYTDVVGRHIDDMEFRYLDRVFRGVYDKGLSTCSLTDDALEAMGLWGGTQSVLSMWNHTDLMRELDRRGILSRLVRADGLRERRGDLKAAYLLDHLSALGVDPADCVLVGDALDDACAAREVGARCVLYAGGITDCARLRATTHPVATSLMEAVRLAEQLS